jgi:hypothetical protein
MANLSYRKSGLTLKKGGLAASRQQVQDLQRDLRRLGYLKNGVDGVFGSQTEMAIKGLQHDLLNNHGAGSDNAAAVKMVDFNKGRVPSVTGEADQSLVECISELLDDGNVPALPSAQNPREENQKILKIIAALPTPAAPIPIVMAILKQESGLRHFNEPGTGDTDTFITVGLDRNVQDQPHIITSRGYGAGQYTLFHHPPTKSEVADFMLDVGKNLRKAVTELRQKFDGFVNGSTSGTQADDRRKEAGTGPLRLCKFKPTEPGYFKDCRKCLEEAGAVDLPRGTPVFEGAALKFQDSPPYYDMTRDAAYYKNVPIRRNIPCDWPYAVRRYNGSGINSYHYQVRMLKNLQSCDF